MGKTLFSPSFIHLMRHRVFSPLYNKSAVAMGGGVTTGTRLTVFHCSGNNGQD